MSDLKTMALQEIVARTGQAQSELLALCRDQNLDIAVRESAAGKVFSSLSKVQLWAEALLKGNP